MAYTLCNEYGQCQPLRLIVPNVHGEPELKSEFTPFWWTCDPCNGSERRFAIEYNSAQNEPSYFPWYQVVTSDDGDNDIAVKIAFYRRVIAARNAMDAAAVEYRRLTGCGWSATLNA